MENINSAIPKWLPASSKHKQNQSQNNKLEGKTYHKEPISLINKDTTQIIKGQLSNRKTGRGYSQPIGIDS